MTVLLHRKFTLHQTRHLRSCRIQQTPSRSFVPAKSNQPPGLLRLALPSVLPIIRLPIGMMALLRATEVVVHLVNKLLNRLRCLSLIQADMLYRLAQWIIGSSTSKIQSVVPYRGGTLGTGLQMRAPKWDFQPIRPTPKQSLIIPRVMIGQKAPFPPSTPSHLLQLTSKSILSTKTFRLLPQPTTNPTRKLPWQPTYHHKKPSFHLQTYPLHAQCNPSPVRVRPVVAVIALRTCGKSTRTRKS